FFGRLWKTRWTLLFPAVLAAGLLWLALRGVNWSEALVALRQGNMSSIAVALVTVTISYYLLGLRWRVLLSAIQPVSPLTAFWAATVGYLGNNFLPARAGEVIRSVMIGQTTGINKSYVLATALTERVMDLLVLVMLTFLLLPLVWS